MKYKSVSLASVSRNALNKIFNLQFSGLETTYLRYGYSRKQINLVFVAEVYGNKDYCHVRFKGDKELSVVAKSSVIIPRPVLEKLKGMY